MGFRGCRRRRGYTEQALGRQNPEPHGAGHASEGCAQAGRSHLQGPGNNSQGPHGQGAAPRPRWQTPGSQCSGQTAPALPTEHCASPTGGPPAQDLLDQTASASLGRVPHRAQDAEEAKTPGPTGQKSQCLASNQDVPQEGREKGPFNPQSGEKSVIQNQPKSDMDVRMSRQGC